MNFASKESVKLRQLTLTDSSKLAELANNKKIFDLVRDLFPHPYTIMDAEEFIACAAKEDPPVTFAIIYRGRLAGVIGLVIQQDVYRKSAELGYWIGEPFWNKGVATLAVDKIIHYAFDELDLVRIFSGVFENNPASGRVLEKNGFRFEGNSKKAVIKNNLLMDEHRFGLINPKYSD